MVMIVFECIAMATDISLSKLNFERMLQGLSSSGDVRDRQI